ncbi:unnamed protein product [Vitrella brassicaformis CCMP3155]|uniref:Dolichyl-diphosphooligosaccharide--protein glycosyltransferase subunit OST2 n=1 Tax=Vitrella brassicaformis (strain CCMP3155) TaxID=1169540 RepID=A0A0G4EC08_VITBC|nr:unnamed protein product [Vitrella brassicaformis CCMP3155]|eukprot:CEL92859.1 unnamed protein product [Vitrella brassicaformis CCMP3155]
MKALSGFVSTLTDIAKSGFQQYKKVTPDRVKLLDLLVIFLGYTAVVQLLYCFIVGSFPFNSFLSGFICCVGSMTLTIGLRVQLMDPEEFKITAERAFADYLVCNLVLFLTVINFLG